LRRKEELLTQKIQKAPAGTKPTGAFFLFSSDKIFKIAKNFFGRKIIIPGGKK
jgi:hypothetical protein